MADIELVIKIPEEEYEMIVNSEDCGLHTLTRAIANGTPLPKGHGRLIDGDAFKKYIRKSYQDVKSCFTTAQARSMASIVTENFCMDIDEEPTILEATEGEDAHS